RAVDQAVARARAAATRAGAGLGALWGRAAGEVSGPARQAAGAARTAVGRLAGRALRAVTGLTAGVAVAWRLRRDVPSAVTAGLSAGAASYLAGPTLTAVACGALTAARALATAARDAGRPPEPADDRGTGAAGCPASAPA